MIVFYRDDIYVNDRDDIYRVFAVSTQNGVSVTFA